MDLRLKFKNKTTTRNYLTELLSIKAVEEIIKDVFFLHTTLKKKLLSK